MKATFAAAAALALVALPLLALADDRQVPGAVPYDLGIGAMGIPAGGFSRRCTIGVTPCDDNPEALTFTEVFQSIKSVTVPDEDVCLWTWDAYPPPGAADATTEPFDYSKLIDQGVEVLEMGLQSYLAMSKEAVEGNCTTGCGIVEWSGVSLGSDLMKALCEAEISYVAEICTDAHLNQEWRWPVSTAIFRLNGKNAKKVDKFLKQWHSASADTRDSLIGSEDLAKAGWGTGGATTAKMFKCSEIPETFRTTEFPPLSLTAPTESGKVVTDEGLQWWRSTPGIWYQG